MKKQKKFFGTVELTIAMMSLMFMIAFVEKAFITPNLFNVAVLLASTLIFFGTLADLKKSLDAEENA